MRYYDKEKEIEELFVKNGFSKEEFVVGTGDTYYKKDKKFIFVFNASNRQQLLDKTAEYAVKYFKEQDFCIIWEVKAKATKNRDVYRKCFSLDSIKAFEANSVAQKGVEFAWQLKENIAVVNLSNLEKIIKNLAEKRN